MTVDDYLALQPEPQRSTLEALRATLREILPDAEETLSYGVPAVRIDAGIVAGYAGFKGHCGYYPHSASVLDNAGDLVDGYERSAGTLRFPIDEPLPHGVVERLVELRRDEIEG